MSNKQRWPAANARKVAEELAAELEPRCKSIEIAGSLGRGKADVGAGGNTWCNCGTGVPS